MAVLFTVWGYDVTVVEFASVILAFLAIALGIQGTRWTWPFYFVSSLLYGWLFVEVHLFASAGMQLIFMAAAIWGWFSWGAEGVRRPGRLTPAVRVGGAVAVIALWAALAPLLQRIGGAATWGDAFMLVGSVAGQLLMVLQKREAWPVWIAVNIVGTVLYASQGLYFTSLFYAILIVMAVAGWRAWSARAAAPDAAMARA
jgi:nicotinamide mononucleotide transporter